MSAGRPGRALSALAALLALLVSLLAACTAEPAVEPLEPTLRARLAEAYGGDGPLQLVAVRRMGSAPFSDPAAGTGARLVYYAARLRLRADIRFDDWGGDNLGRLLEVLGAAERGVQGLRPGGNRAGEELVAFGALAFEPDGRGGFRPLPWTGGPPSAGPVDPDDPGAVASRALIEQLLALFRGRPVPEPVRRAVVREELVRATDRIDRRLAGLEGRRLIAAGPEGGEYLALARALAAAAPTVGLELEAAASEGSRANLRLLAEGEPVVLGIVQSDLLAAERPPGLVALASLFPEPVQILVPAGSPIRAVDQLEGRRIELGPPESGMRATALALLAAHGLGPDRLASAGERDLGAATLALEAGKIDAIVAVTAAPARVIADLARRLPVRLLEPTPEAIAALTGPESGRVALRLRPGLYPGVAAPVATVAPTAVLVARAELEAATVERILELLFERADYPAFGSVAGAMISPARARRGLPIPLHPAAAARLPAASPGG